MEKCIYAARRSGNSKQMVEGCSKRNMENNILKWLQNWHKSYCNDEWEHIAQRISISTIDNPGWRVDIDLNNTELETIRIEYTLIDNSEEDWYTYKLVDGKFNGNGDPDKLEIILNKFKEIVESNNFNRNL